MTGFYCLNEPLESRPVGVFGRETLILKDFNLGISIFFALFDLGFNGKTVLLIEGLASVNCIHDRLASRTSCLKQQDTFTTDCSLAFLFGLRAKHMDNVHNEHTPFRHNSLCKDDP